MCRGAKLITSFSSKTLLMLFAINFLLVFAYIPTEITYDAAMNVRENTITGKLPEKQNF